MITISGTQFGGMSEAFGGLSSTAVNAGLDESGASDLIAGAVNELVDSATDPSSYDILHGEDVYGK